MADIQGGPAQPVQQSSLAPSSGPAIPIAVLTDVEATARGIVAGPALSVVAVADNRARIGGAALPVVISSGNGFMSASPSVPVYVVSGSLAPSSMVVNVFAVFGGQGEPIPSDTVTTKNYRRNSPVGGRGGGKK